MATTAVFSAPASIILNQRLLSPRGGILKPTIQPEDALRFQLFMNSNSTSAYRGLTLQISALRNMAREHNPDKIPEHQAYIFFPTNSFMHCDCVEPKQDGTREKHREGMKITEEQAQEIDRMMRKFCVIKGSTDLSELRHLMFKCMGASLDSSSIPKLRCRALESELKRIFGTVKTANELEDAVLEIDCLLPAMNGKTNEAIWAFRDAAEEDLEARGANWRAAENMKGKGASRAKDHRTNANSTNWRGKGGSGVMDDEAMGSTPKKLIGAGVIDGKFVSPDKAPWRKEKGQAAAHSKGSIPDTTSPQKYLHPHTFDPVKTQHDNFESEGKQDDTFHTEGATLVG